LNWDFIFTDVGNASVLGFNRDIFRVIDLGVFDASNSFDFDVAKTSANQNSYNLA
jgi:hypothetical protein